MTAPAAPHTVNPIERLKVVTWRVPQVDAERLEAVTVDAQTDHAFLTSLRDACGATELVYFPTCQRVLFAFVSATPTADLAARVAAAFAERSSVALPHPEAFAAFDAFGHLAEVASSIDSLVPGEPQVLGQMKDAFKDAERDGLIGQASRGLAHVFPLVFRTAKAVRSRTELFRGKVSLIPLTLDVITAHLKERPDPVAVVVGTGEMGTRMTELITAAVPGVRIVRASRSAKRGHPVAALLAKPRPADLIAFATPTTQPLFHAAHAEAFCAANGAGRPLLVVDVGLPRAASAAVGDVPGVRLVALDELTRLSENAKASRHAELDRARDVLNEELGRVRAEYAALPALRQVTATRQELAAAAEERFALGAERFPDQFADPEFRKWFEQTTRHLAHVAQRRVRAAVLEPSGGKNGHGEDGADTS